MTAIASNKNDKAFIKVYDRDSGCLLRVYELPPNGIVELPEFDLRPQFLVTLPAKNPASPVRGQRG